MNRTTCVTRPWQVLLIGGASGSGKTSVSYRLAHHFNVGITEVDDFQVILERMTTPELPPELHWGHTHPEAIPADEIAEHVIDVCRVMAPALEAVINTVRISRGASLAVTKAAPNAPRSGGRRAFPT